MTPLYKPSLSEQPESAVVRYGGAVLAIGVATLLRLWLEPWLEGAGFAIFFVAVVIAAWFGGLGPSLLALVACVLVSTWFFKEPPKEAPEPAARVLIGLGAFFFVGIATALLSESMRAAQRRARAKADEAVRQREQLRDADRRKDEFLATLAHELRNPLAPLRTGVELLRHSAGNPQRSAQTLDMMDRQLQQMVRLIDDLLDVSRITQGKMRLRLEPCDLQAVLACAVESSRPSLAEAGIELTVSSPSEPLPLHADAARLAQVFSNLLHNVAKYTPRGGQAWFTAERQGSEVIVKVRDTGIGIPTEMLAHIFDMFTQVDRSFERTHGGLGIGLSLVRALVALHGGAVEARSEGTGKGSEFVVRLPVAVGETAVPEKPRLPASDGEAACRVLVVDDNQDAAKTLEMLLQTTGSEVRTAYDGLEAVAAALEFRPDLVLLDIGLPKLNGYDAARRIREQPHGPDIMLVALTGWGADEDRARSKQAGFDQHFVKPIDTAELHELVRSVAASLR